jgi:hypothetical protein
MKKRIAVVVVSACVAASATGALAAPKPFSVLAVRTSGSSTKTTSSFTENLLTGTKVVGHDAIKCKVVSKTTACMGTFTFKAGGTISINSTLIPQGNDATFKISGGTGPYASASGTLALAVSKTSTKLTFELS